MRRPVIVLAVLDAAVVLLPPVHWLVAGGSAVLGIGYFLLTGLLLCGSLLVIARLER